MTDDELDVLMTEARSLAHDYNASSWLDDAADIGNQLAALTPKLAAALSAEVARRERVEAALYSFYEDGLEEFPQVKALPSVLEWAEEYIRAALADPTDAETGETS